MNIPSLLLLLVIALLFLYVAVLIVRRHQRGGGCAECARQGCPFRKEKSEQTVKKKIKG